MATLQLCNFLLLLLLSLQTLSLTLAAVTAPALKTFIVRVDASAKPSVYPTHYHWYSSSDFSADTFRILHVYDTVFHGFSAVLRPDQAAAASAHPSVLAVFEDRRLELHTTRSPQFLGLHVRRGLWSASDFGSDVIIGILDTGIWPERRSFSDLNVGPVPSRWRGACDAGDAFKPSLCNRKLIGARSFHQGQEAAAIAAGLPGINRTAEFLSPRDADGHGTHTASTAAGWYAFGANMSGYAPGVAKGVAPKARLAVYKVCWKEGGCLTSDILAAFDAAVADGVDVISISIGGGDGMSSPYYLDPIAIGAYGSVARGVFVASSAGNDGPIGSSVTNVAPWLATVGAGTIDRNFPAEVVLGDGRVVPGVSLYAGPPLDGKKYPLVYPGGRSQSLAASLCMENSLDRKMVAGAIVVCDRGSIQRVQKGVVVRDAGGVGMILANNAASGESLVGDAHLIPACGVGQLEGKLIKDYLASSSPASATINFRGTMIGIKPAPVVASFSGRGPNALSPEVLKPDLIAPGVNILAAWTEAAGPTGLVADRRKTEFNILSGTSMSCPHVGGAAALLKSAHPDWTPAMIRSAMMTTASIVDNRVRVMTDESTGNSSTPYDFGAGTLDLERALDPGLVYDISGRDYVDFLCAIGYDARSIQVITRSKVSCPGSGKSKRPAPENLNYPSMVALVSARRAAGLVTKKMVRTATNVGAPNAVYESRIEAPPGEGVTVAVSPERLVFREGVRKQRFVVTITADRRALDGSGVRFGSLSWVEGVGKHVVRSPIVVTQIGEIMG